jgi:hypothetical protein
MVREGLVRAGLLVAALVAIVVGLNLMNVRDNLTFLAGVVATIGGFLLGGVQLWALFKGMKQ